MKCKCFKSVNQKYYKKQLRKENPSQLFNSLLKLYYSSFSKSSFEAPHTGHTQSSGNSSNGVPGAIPLSGSP